MQSTVVSRLKNEGMASMRRYCFFVFIAALLSVTACDQKSKGTGAGSEARGVHKVRVFTWSDYMDPKTDSGFSAATGIPVETEYFESNRVLEQRLMGRKSGFDVVVPALERALRTGTPVLLALSPGAAAPARLEADVIPAALRELEVASGCAADYDGWLAEAV